MLRPATPLTILLFAAFALLLISVLSTPIIQAIPLATFDGVDFGVFGVCKDNKCSSIEIGYDVGTLFSASQTATFDLPNSTRTTLSAILIVHPIAALFTLVMLVLSASAHLHAPSHSPRYLLGIFILSILTLILALLSFLIDVLLFVPHMAWGSYIVLAATILIAASGIVSCAMRRTLVSRKARKRRIAENAEMNGDNFYNRRGTDPTVPPTLAAATTVDDGLSATDKPGFATFETSKKLLPDRTSDERIPLTMRTPTENSPTNPPPFSGMGVDGYAGGGPQVRGPGGSPPRDRYGNPMPRPPPPGSYGMRSRDPSADPSLNRQYSDPSTNSRGRGEPGGFRGRGGFAPNGRGGYGPPGRGGYGPPRGAYYNGPPRGGYNGPYRGGMGESMMAGGMAAGAVMRGGRGAPPPGYGAPQNGRGYNNMGPGPGPGPGGYDRRPSAPGQQPAFANEQYAAPPPPPPAATYVPYNPDDSRSSLPRAESPPPMPELEQGPVGQAIEMDATTGSPSAAPAGFGQFGNIRDSDGDVAGMVGLQQSLQQQRSASVGQRQTMASETSRYSEDQPYVPPRQAWGDAGPSSPLNPSNKVAELPSPTGAPNHRRQSSAADGSYYEDVDPRFAEPSADNIPAAVAPPGYNNPRNNSPNRHLRPIQPIGNLDGHSSYEDLQSGARSPAESDRSNFTSVSQRGINPRWNGGQGYGAPMPQRRPLQQQTDMLLNSNPDFQLPGARGGRAGPPRGGGGRGLMPGSAYPGGAL